MSKSSKIVSTALAKLNDGSAMAKKAWKNSDLTSKASALVGAGASLAALKKGGSAAVKTVRKHPIGTAVTAAALAAVGAAVYAVNKRKKNAKPAVKKASKQVVAKKATAKKTAAKKAPAKKSAARKTPAKKAASKKAAAK